MRGSLLSCTELQASADAAAVLNCGNEFLSYTGLFSHILNCRDDHLSLICVRVSESQTTKNLSFIE